MYRVHGDKVIRRTNYRKENDIQKYTKILKEDFGNMCGYCGKDFNIIKCPYQKDHLIPEDIASYMDYSGINMEECFQLTHDEYENGNVDRIVKYIEKN